MSKTSKTLKRLIPLFFIILTAAITSYLAWRGELFHFRATAEKLAVVKIFTFSQGNSLKEWEEKLFKNKVIYDVEKSKELSYVKATSESAASALYYKVRMDTRYRHPVIKWKWNVNKFPLKKNKESLETISENDFAARVYVIFPAMFILNSKVIEYIWSETLPEGTTGTSPYSKNIKMIVVQTGENPEHKWYAEERDVVDDYTKLFGQKPEKDMGAVAFMTNSEHTGSEAMSLYDDIELGYRENNKMGR